MNSVTEDANLGAIGRNRSYLVLDPFDIKTHRTLALVAKVGSLAGLSPSKPLNVILTVQLFDNQEARSVSEELELRRAVATDASAIRDLTREAYAKWVPVIGREPKPMTADYAEAVRSHRIDLLYVDGELAALIETIPQADHLLIENVAVSPAFQGRGLGRKLMAHAEQIAASLGHDEIRLYTNKLFAENVRLYRVLGYRIDREEAFKGGFAVHMSKSVTSDGMAL